MPTLYDLKQKTMYRRLMHPILEVFLYGFHFPLLQSLLDRAFKIKEDIIDNLNLQHGTWQEEKHARALLQEHIRTITDVVRKLSRDIQVSTVNANRVNWIIHL